MFAKLTLVAIESGSTFTPCEDIPRVPSNPDIDAIKKDTSIGVDVGFGCIGYDNFSSFALSFGLDNFGSFALSFGYDNCGSFALCLTLQTLSRSISAMTALSEHHSGWCFSGIFRNLLETSFFEGGIRQQYAKPLYA